ncbi:MAG TPA: hypothetical protein DCS24_07085 [Erythrobacter sp.]|nr:hypothetical protein [Erythrobacter sp.]
MWFLLSACADGGKTVDLYINGPLELLIEIWSGEKEADEAISEEELILTGEPLLAETAKHWFPLSPVARVKKQEGGIAAMIGA